MHALLPSTYPAPVSVLTLPRSDSSLAVMRATPPHGEVSDMAAASRTALGVEDGPWIGVMAPGAWITACPTRTLNCRIILSGRLEVELDDGRKLDLSAGDVVMDRGAVQAWSNTGDQPCRIAFISPC